MENRLEPDKKHKSTVAEKNIMDMTMAMGRDEHLDSEAQKADGDVGARKVGVDVEALPQQRCAVPLRDLTRRFSFGKSLFLVDFGILLDCGSHSSWRVCTRL